jgi:hypothetical protein
MPGNIERIIEQPIAAPFSTRRGAGVRSEITSVVEKI